MVPTHGCGTRSSQRQSAAYISEPTVQRCAARPGLPAVAPQRGCAHGRSGGVARLAASRAPSSSCPTVISGAAWAPTPARRGSKSAASSSVSATTRGHGQLPRRSLRPGRRAPGPRPRPRPATSLRLAVSTDEAVSARALRTLDRPARGRFPPISGHEERQLGLALAAQDVEVDIDAAPAASRRGDSRQSHARRRTGNKIVRGTTSLSSASSMLAGSPRTNDLWGVGGLCQPAERYVVVGRCRALAAGTRAAGPRFVERC